MKRALLLLLALTASLVAAPWDGTRGNITLFTTSFSTGMPGLIVMPNPSTFTMLWISTVEPTTTSFRVMVKYTSDQGPAVAVTFCDRLANARGAVAAFQLDPSKITGVTVEELRTISSVDFQ